MIADRQMRNRRRMDLLRRQRLRILRLHFLGWTVQDIARGRCTSQFVNQVIEGASLAEVLAARSNQASVYTTNARTKVVKTLRRKADHVLR